MVRTPPPCRIHPNLMRKINQVRAKALLSGRKSPSISKITEAMAKQIKDEVLWNEFIRF